MSRSVSLGPLVVLAALTVLAAGAISVAGAGQLGAVPANHSQVVPTANTSNSLTIDGPTHQSFVHADVDVAGATAISAERLQGEHEARTFEHRYDRAGDGARVAVVRATVEDAEQQLDRLTAKQERIYQAYTNRSINQATLVRKLAVLEAESAQVAHVQERVRKTLESDIETSLPVGLDRRVSGLKANVVGLPAPLSSGFTSAVSGQSGPFRAYAEGSTTGLIVATIDTEAYVRQATVLSAYAPDQTNQFEGSITEAYQRALDLYPWVAEEALNGPNLVERGTGIYRVNAEHPHGELTTYLNGGSGEVFHEIQRKQPDSVPILRTIHNETAVLNVTLERSTATGPMRVTVTEPDGSPVRATVSINRQVVGTTDAGGELWTIQPSGGFRVNATADGRSIIVTGP